MHMCIWRPEINIRYLPQHVIHLIFFNIFITLVSLSVCGCVCMHYALLYVWVPTNIPSCQKLFIVLVCVCACVCACRSQKRTLDPLD